MAIARGAGTEILRAHHFTAIDDTVQDLIVGVQHHIYTVLSVIVHCSTLQATGNWFQLHVTGYSAGETVASNQTIKIFREDFSAAQTTFVWDNKFSFNGTEGTALSSVLSTAAEQDLIADQATTTAQVLRCQTEHADDSYHVHVTFIDQSNE